MTKITVGNSYSKIEGLEAAPFEALRKALSYRIDAQAAFFSKSFGPQIKYMIDKRGEFPTGLLTKVKELLRTYPVNVVVNDTRTKPKSLKLPMDLGKVTPYPDQRWAAEAIRDKHRGCISAPTGSGKSLIIALIIGELKVKTLVVVPSLEIKRQLSDVLEAYFGNTPLITVENIDSNALKSSKSYDLLIIDECHHVAAKTYQKLNKSAWSGIYYRALLTATPFRNNPEETLLFEGIAGDIVYAIAYQNAVKSGYIVPVEAYYFQVPKQPTNAYTWAEVYSQLVVNNQVRNELIASILSSLESKALLCLVKEIRHGEILSDLTGIPFANGQDESTRDYIRQFNSGEIKALIGTTGVLGEGIDTKPAEYVIIAGLGKARSAFQQQVGRVLRRYGDKDSGKVLLFSDKSHKFTQRHFKAQTTILKEEYNVTPIQLEF